jgi:hypothetical protein
MVIEPPKVSHDNVWVYDPKLMTLSICRPHAPYPHGMDYEVDLEEVTTAKDVVDWIDHLSDRDWFHGKVLSDFVESLVVYLPLGDLVHGKGTIDPAAHLRQFKREQRASSGQDK